MAMIMTKRESNDECSFNLCRKHGSYGLCLALHQSETCSIMQVRNAERVHWFKAASKQYIYNVLYIVYYTYIYPRPWGSLITGITRKLELIILNRLILTIRSLFTKHNLSYLLYIIYLFIYKYLNVFYTYFTLRCLGLLLWNIVIVSDVPPWHLNSVNFCCCMAVYQVHPQTMCVSVSVRVCVCVRAFAYMHKPISPDRSHSGYR